jgi:hypothetical protein
VSVSGTINRQTNSRQISFWKALWGCHTEHCVSESQPLLEPHTHRNGGLGFDAQKDAATSPGPPMWSIRAALHFACVNHMVSNLLQCGRQFLFANAAYLDEEMPIFGTVTIK